METDLGEKLLAYLSTHDRSRRYVAQKLGYTPSAFSKWIDGTNPMPVKAIRGFCDLFKLDEAEYIELLRLAGHNVIIVDTSKDKSRIKLTEKSTSPNHLTFETEERHITIGRASTNSLQPPDKTVSWEHGQIDLRQGGYFYRHLSKGNRSIVRRSGEEYLLRAGSLQEEIQLQNQDRLIIGDTTFVVEFDLINEDVGYTTTAKPQDDS